MHGISRAQNLGIGRQKRGAQTQTAQQRQAEPPSEASVMGASKSVCSLIQRQGKDMPFGHCCCKGNSKGRDSVGHTYRRQACTQEDITNRVDEADMERHHVRSSRRVNKMLCRL